MKLLLILFLMFISVSSPVYSDQLARPDMHAPMSVMGDHGHKKGELMLSYRYGRMEMDGNRSGSNSVGTANVLKAFPVSPLNMTMEMHMFGAMYGLSNDLTLMAMVPYADKSMDLVNRAGNKFRTHSKGLGDIKIFTIYELDGRKSTESNDMPYRRLTFNLGLSLPSGDINKKDHTPLGYIRLPYPMQLGSGTYDPMIGMTYASFYPQWSWGGQLSTTQRVGKNNEGYRLGDAYQVTAWVAYRHSDYLSASLGLYGKSWNNISGRDKRLNPAMVPTARSDLRAGENVEFGAGINYIQPHGMLKGHRLAAEFLVPVYQHLDGPQLETDYRYILGWQAVF